VGSRAVTIAADADKPRRIIAAYKLRLAERAKDIGAPPETWGRGKIISIEEESQYLTAEDKYRIAPYPYPGLRSFDPQEGELFFGREKNVEALRAILAEHRVVVVLGGSGSGKSSLVRAGLLPFLNTDRRIKGRNGNWYPAEFRPRTDPLGELSIALVNQVLLPLLALRRKGLAEALQLPANADPKAESTVKFLQDSMRRRFAEAKRQGRKQVLDALLEIVDHELDSFDNIVTQGRRLAEPNLFLLVDQLEEIFRPEIAADEREALLNLIVDLQNHMQDTSQRGGLFLAATIRSEEVHRCAEHRGLSEVVIGSGYQIELLDPGNEEDAADLRHAIVLPARNVFKDWGLGHFLDHDDAPFAKGLPDLLLEGAKRLSVELSHRPDQLPLLQHALQAMWHSAMRRWSRPDFKSDRLEITRNDLPGQAQDWKVPDLSACLQARADKADVRAVERFAESIGSVGDNKIGQEALRAAFRSLARRDDQGNWARRFAGRDEMTAFLTADPTSAVARLLDDQRWNALQEALRVFRLRGYMSQGNEQKYDISHEALIRNWPLFQEWLRVPEEVAYALSRVLQEVEPAKYEKAWFLGKIRLIPKDLADRVTTVAKGGSLPTRWGEDQIAPYLLKPTLRKLWGGEKSEALSRLTAFAASAKRAAEVRSGLVFLGFLMIGIAILGALYSIGANSLRAERAESEAALRVQQMELQSKARTEAFTKYAKEAAAYNLISSTQASNSNWPDGLRERAAIQALKMLEGGGQEGNQTILHDFAWKNWDSGVRTLLGQTLRVEKSEPNSQFVSPACRSYIAPSEQDGSDHEPLVSEPVDLAGAPGTKIRFLIKVDNGSARLFFQTTRNGTDWNIAKEERPFDPIPGTRFCLAPGGAALTMSYRGSSFPNLFELDWYTCRSDQHCTASKWQVVRQQIASSPLASAAIHGGPFSCVRSIRSISQSEGVLARIEVDFTGETLEQCDDAAPWTPGHSELFRGTYLPGIVRPAWNDGSLRVNSGKFTECKEANEGSLVLRRCELTASSGKSLSLTLTYNYSDVWSVSIRPVDQDYPVNDVQLVGPPITAAAFDEHNNIWLGDDKGHAWVLINNRNALEDELWRRAAPLQLTPDWPDRFPEVSVNMTPAEIKTFGRAPNK
jgi:hypothetical protein